MSLNKAIPVQTLPEMISGLGYSWHSPDYYISADQIIASPSSTAPFRPDFYGLILCNQGWMDLTVNSETVHIGDNHFFAAGPNSIIQRSNQSPDCKTKAIYFTKPFLLKHHVNAHQLEAFEFFSNEFNKCIPLTRKDAEPLIKLYDILLDKREPQNVQYHQEIIRNLFFAYVYEAASIYQQKGNVLLTKYTREIDITYKFRELLTKHATSRHQLKFYADSLFISEKYLIRAIKRSTGKTPGELIDDTILAEAKIRLKEQKDSIAIIAEVLHFSDQASFSKFFKKHTGHSPSDFRRLP